MISRRTFRGSFVELAGNGKWTPATSSFDLHLRRGRGVDFKMTGTRIWQRHADGVYLSAESLSAKALGQTVKADLSGAFPP